MKEICGFIWCSLADNFSDPGCSTTKYAAASTKAMLILESTKVAFNRDDDECSEDLCDRRNELEREIPFYFAKFCRLKSFPIMQRVVLFLFALLIFMIFWVISHLKFFFFPPQATIPKSIIFILLLTGFLNDCFGVWLYLPRVSYLGISKLAHVTYKLTWTIIQNWGNVLRLKKKISVLFTFIHLSTSTLFLWNQLECQMMPAYLLPHVFGYIFESPVGLPLVWFLESLFLLQITNR